MGSDMQLLECSLRFGGGHVKRIVGRKAQSLHPYTQTRQKPQISAKNFTQFVRLGGGEVIGVHRWRVYSDDQRREGSKKADLGVEKQTVA